jgi:homoserine dehydrogenase
MASRKPLRLALLGFGSVGRRFAENLLGGYGRILRGLGVEPRVTAIATARHGSAADPRGLALRRALSLVRSGRPLGGLDRVGPFTSSADFVKRAPADVLFELSPLDPRSGEPATTHVRLALGRGLHVITANKGPVAFALGGLQSLARRRGVLFLHEGAVMDGAPVFNLVARCLPGIRIRSFRGALNSTTTRILARMEEGATAEAALREAQAAGVAEADPRNDLDGWDAAVKGCAIANALMGARLSPSKVRRTGIGGITLEDVGSALAAGHRFRLVVRGVRAGRAVRVTVAPERIPTGDLLVTPGCDGVVVLDTDLMGEIGIWEGAGGVDQTAYALLADLVAIVEAARRSG